MDVRVVLIMFISWLLTGCVNQPGYVQTETIGLVPASELGVTVDENLRVLDLDPQGSAALAGVQNEQRTHIVT